jgi:hypothetical protein
MWVALGEPWGMLGVEYQKERKRFFGGGSETREERPRAAHGLSILRWAQGAVKLRKGEGQSHQPVVAGGLAPDCEPVYGHHD